MRDPVREVARALASAFLAGPWERRAMYQRARAALGWYWIGLGGLVAQTVRGFGSESPRGWFEELARWLERSPALRREVSLARMLREGRPYVDRWLTFEPAMN